MHPIHLIVPDAPLREALAEQLALAGFGIVEAYTLSQAFESRNAVALIADEAACDKKALAVLRHEKGQNKYVFLLGVMGGAPHDAPITESFPKPLRLGHLLARLKFYLETAPRLRGKPLTFGPFRLEPHNRQIVTEGGAVIHLTEKETALLEYLGHRNSPVTREELLAAIWGYDARIDTHTLETHIYQLRRKLGFAAENSAFLINEQGAYRLTAS
jgi:DNA-binding response OmpR family regulator